MEVIFSGLTESISQLPLVAGRLKEKRRRAGGNFWM